MILTCHDLFSFVLLQPGIGDRFLPFFAFQRASFGVFSLNCISHLSSAIHPDQTDDIQFVLVRICKRVHSNGPAQDSHFKISTLTVTEI
jgi:hypothetical protein